MLTRSSRSKQWCIGGGVFILLACSSAVFALSDTAMWDAACAKMESGDLSGAQAMASELHARWTAYDAESGIIGYQYAIRTSPQGSNDVLDWTDTTQTEALAQSLSLQANTTYYFAVKAKNGAGTLSETAGVSDGIICTPGKVIHVKTDGSDNNNGSSWALAKLTVQGGISAASSSQEVWVAAGEYTPDSTISITSGVALYGGFAGDESVRIDRDWKTRPTILDGDHQRTVVSVASSQPVVIDGFIIQNGNGTGLYAYNSPLAVIHNVFTGNSSMAGGGVSLDSCTSLNVSDNLLVNNSADWGGGMYLYASSGSVTSNTIADNAGLTYPEQAVGGGIYFDGSPSVLLTNNVIADNVGGGVYTRSGIPARSFNCLFANGDYEYWEGAPGFGDVFADPVFVDAENGDYRLSSSSPCRNTGAGQYVESTLDLGMASRIQGGVLDMGAYEYGDGTYYTLSLTPGTNPVAAGSQLSVVAAVADPLNGAVACADVHFTVSGGSVTPSQAATDDDGVAQVTITRSTPGTVTLTASVYVPRCATWVTRTVWVYFYGADALSTDWPTFMHDAQHTGYSPEAHDTPEDLALMWAADVPTAETDRTHGVWSVDVGETQVYHANPAGGLTWIFEHPYIDSSPIVVGNVVVVGTWDSSGKYVSSTGCVKAFDAQTGVLRWRFPSDTAQNIGGVASTACYYDGSVYVGSADGNLFSLDLATGAQVWARATTDRSASPQPSRILSSPVVHEGIVYITNEASKVYAFTADTAGSTVNGYPILLPIDSAGHNITDVDVQNITGASSPAVATVNDVDYLLFGCDDGWLYRLRLSDQQLVCQYLHGCVESSPMVHDGTVYVGVSYWGSTYPDLVAVPVSDVPTTSYVSAYLGEEIRATPAVVDGHLFVGQDTGTTFHRLDADTLDQDPPPGQSSPNPFHGDAYFVGSSAFTSAGYGFVGNDGESLFTLSTADVSLINARPTGGVVCSSPAISYAAEPGYMWVYVVSRADGGKLLAYRQQLDD